MANISGCFGSTAYFIQINFPSHAHLTKPKFINWNFCLQPHVLSGSNLKSFWNIGNCQKELQGRKIQNERRGCLDEMKNEQVAEFLLAVLSSPTANLIKPGSFPSHSAITEPDFSHSSFMDCCMETIAHTCF